MAFAVSLTATQLARVKVAGATDKKGNPAAIDGVPTFSSADPAFVTFEPDPADTTGFTAIASAVGPVTPPEGVGLKIEADADLGAGVETISEAGLATVVAGKAATFAVEVGTPEEQP